VSTTDDDGLEPTEPVEPVDAAPQEPAPAPRPRDPNAADRRAIGFGLGVLVIALVMVLVGGLVSAASDDDDDAELAAEDETTTTVEDEETTTTSEATTTTTVAETTTTAAPGSTTVALTPACRNSTDRACGAFRWDPQPGANQRMVVDVTVSPSNPRAGEVVTITFAIREDAVPRLERAEYGDGTSPALGDSRCAAQPPEGFGPWTPPTQQAGTFTLTDTHVYAQPGTYRYRNAVNSSSWGDRTPPGDSRRCPRDPYADSVVAELTIPVS
jgi:hypothetical protein